jgi:DNA-binding NarL/FixJ family response regulator
MEKIRIIHSRPAVGDALMICLEKVNIQEVEVAGELQPLDAEGGDPIFTLVESSQYKAFIDQQKDAVAFALLVTSDEDPNITEALYAGAVSFINIAKGPAHFAKHIERFSSNHLDESSQFIKSYLANQNIKPNDEQEAVHNLTPKEVEVLKKMRDGKHLKLIASETDTAYETVRTHVKRIYKKLGVMSASEAVIKAMKMKLE